MGLWRKLSCLVLVLLVTVATIADSRQNVHDRNWGQPDSWRNNYPPRSGSPRAYPYGGFLYADFSALNPISLQCAEDQMVVSVQRDLYGTGKMVKPSDLTLGPRQCKPSSLSTDTTVIFQNGLQDCGNTIQMTTDWLIYSTNLTYSPTPSSNSPIIRTNSAIVLIQCFYPRYGNVSSNAIKPTWYPFSSTVSSEERLSFSLQLMNDDWSSPRTSAVFQLGDIFHIEASIDTGNHVPMILYIDSCVATLSPDVNSNPRYEIIALNGCLLDGKQADSSSAFRSPRTQSDKLQFLVDAFRFTGTDSSTIYITCNLRAAVATQSPDPVNKACSFSKTTNTWSPLEGTNNICSCCDTGNCVQAFPQSRRVGQYYPGSRVGKRDAGSEQEKGLATLGPILVIGPESNKALAVTQESKPQQFWGLVIVVSLSIVVLTEPSGLQGQEVDYEPGDERYLFEEAIADLSLTPKD
ncbi:zona pellucida sperm-binding protein 3-like [Discoglossus pictus]